MTPPPIDASTAWLFFNRLMESLPDHVYFKDREGRFVYINRAHAAYLGLLSPEEAVGKSDYDFFEESLARQKDADEREIVRTGIGFVGKEEKASSKTGKVRWVVTSKLPLFGESGDIIGTFGISRNITEIKQAREKLDEHHRLLQTLIEILPCRIFVKDRGGRLRLTNDAYRKALGLAASVEVEGRLLSELVADDRTRAYAADDAAVLDGHPILNREDFDASPLGDKRWMLLSKVPLRDGAGDIQGIVGMAADITEQKDAEARAVRANRQLEEKNLEIETELALARELVTELMVSSMRSVREELDPAAPFAPQLAFHYEACAHLAGDFFQLIPRTPRSFGLLLCDVMGHGVKAALVTTMIRGLLADLRAEEMHPSEVLARLNQRLCPLLDRPPLPRFVTALYASIDISSGQIQLASAGHPAPLRQCAGAAPQALASPELGPALGLISGATFPSVTQSLAHGDRLLFFTDGWTEETNPAGEEYGRERLARSLVESCDLAPEALLARAAERVRQFSRKRTHTDDLCAVLAGF